MQLHLALAAVLVPILLIEWPRLQSSIDMGISGTYDVLLFSFSLPQEQVLKLLPDQLRSQDRLLPVPADVIAAIASGQEGEEGSAARTHPVLLQMGYQMSTGPGPTWMPKFSFNECKLEVPFVRHPSDDSGTEPFTFKQHILFSNLVIKMGSQASGLRSSTAQFRPPATPSHAPGDSQTIRYQAAGYVDATATQSPDSSSASWSVYRDMVEAWWFGGGTARGLVQKFAFDWEGAAIKPEAYSIDAELHLAAFAEPGSDLGKMTVKGQGWRTKATLSSTSRTL